ASVDDNGRLGVGLVVLLISVSALSHLLSGAPQPSDGAVALARGGGVIGWVTGQPFVAGNVLWLGVVVAALLLVLSLFIITKTPPNRIGRRFRELYAYLFGEQLEEPAPKPAKGSGDTTEAFGDFGDLGIDPEEAASLPWWRRNKTQRETDPAFDSPVIERVSNASDDSDTEAFGIELLEELTKAEDAV